ncbi:serine hydrolase [Cohnella sp. WQ 127256]|uniref:serine hydrolase n=1 Tax=Cohnella sp. WQ 127256 TaxID=2938790 RepID=UPI0021174F9C|nr:serine hydrolase [Cohnella sp. WQ 127256]
MVGKDNAGRIRMAVILLFIMSLFLGYTPRTSANPTEWNTKELSAFFDGYMDGKLDKAPGAVIIAVNSEGVLFSQGYGYADKEHKLKANPDSTEYRVGSISKLFTSSAIMQLVEQGEIRLDEDINKYLPFRIPNRKDHPIELAHLLTHTAGFDETVQIGNENWPPSPDADLGDFKNIYIPPILRDPGSVKSYSNFGMSLAGYIVQRQSGVPFTQYIDEHILHPLQMDNSSFQPKPEIISHLAVPYGAAGQPIQEWNLKPAYIPAGGLFATASDMGKFMMSFLQEGKTVGDRILNADTKAEMMSLQSSFNPLLGGMGYGFFIKEGSDGAQIIWHGGDLPGWHSILWLIPEMKTGVFVAVNGDGDPGLPTELMRLFLNRFMPWTVAATAPDSGQTSSFEAQPAVDLAGRYIINRHISQSVYKIATLSQNIRITVTANEDGSITASGMGNPETYTYDRNGLWRNVLGDNSFSSYKDRDGEFLQFSGSPAADFRRIAWYEDEQLHGIIIIGFALLFVLGILVWMIGSFRYRSMWRSIPGIVCGIYMVFCAGIIVIFNNANNLGVIIGQSMKVVLSLPIIAALLLAIELMRWVNEWRKWKPQSERRVLGILRSSGRMFLIMLQLAFLLYLNYWNLLGWSGLE